MQPVKNLRSSLKRITQHLLALGIPLNEAKRFTSLVERWTRDSGPEWTVTRLKSLKTAMVEMLATREDYKVPPGWATRVSRKGRRIFKETLLHDLFTRAHSNITIATGFLRTYQALELKHLSRIQREKMEQAIESPATISLDALLETISGFTMRPVDSEGIDYLLRVGESADPLINMIGGDKRSPYFVATPDSFHYKGSHTRNSVECFAFEDYLQKDVAVHDLQMRYPEDVSRRLIGSENYPFIEVDRAAVLDVPAGTLVPLQEGGCKVRWIANPLMILQAFGEPLKDKLLAYSRMAYPNIYTEDQDSGRLIVNEWLVKGYTVYSYDCTSFTDRFPLKLQEFTLQQLTKMGLVTNFDNEAFQLVLSKPWYSPSIGRTVRWSVGQPLGYGPSFHLATLSHAMVLDNLDRDRTGLWAVVGDDVVIADAGLAMAYQEFMTKQAGVEINSSKSVISPFLGEFLGKLISVEGVIPAIKVKPFTHPDQIVQAIAFYGQEALMFLNGRQRELALKCFLPEHLGGLGLKPDSTSNAGYLSQLNMTRVVTASVKRDMSNFHGCEPFKVHSQKELVSLKAEILAQNTKTIQLLGIAEIQHYLGDDETTINGLTHLPTCCPRDKRNSVLLPNSPRVSPHVWPSSGFVETQDKIWSLESDHGPKSYVYQGPIQGLGYIDPREKPSTLNGPTPGVKTNDERKSHGFQFHKQFKGFFRNWKEFLQGISPAQNGTKKQVEKS